MINKNFIKMMNNLTIEELQMYVEVLSDNSNEEIKNKLEQIIKRKEEKKKNESLPLNLIATTEWLLENKFISIMEYEVYIELGIKNMQDLVDYDMSKVTYDVCPSWIKERMEFNREFLNFPETKKQSEKKYKKGRKRK